MFSSILLVIFILGATSNAFDFLSNDWWKRNDDLLTTVDFIYDNLAGPIQNDVCSSQKRSFSIIAQSIMNHVKKPDKPTEKIVKKANKLLGYPADVLAADVRRDLNLLRVIIDQPINDIKRHCLPNTTTVNCENDLTYYTALQTLDCPFYPKHVSLRRELENLLLEEDFQNLLEDAIKSSVNGTDNSALSFSVDRIVSRSPVLEKMAALYNKYKDEIFPCMYGLFEKSRHLLCPKAKNLGRKYMRNWNL